MITIETPRLILRPFKKEDVDQVVALCNDWELAKTTLGLPYPYGPENFLPWMERHAQQFEDDIAYEFAVTDKETGAVLGAISVMGINMKHRHGELGYWLGAKYWNNGYATEAARALVDFCFKEKNFNKVFARHFAVNPASGRVMQKIGMKYEGTQRRHYYRNDTWQDVVFYGVLYDEWQ